MSVRCMPPDMHVSARIVKRYAKVATATRAPSSLPTSRHGIDRGTSPPHSPPSCLPVHTSSRRHQAILTTSDPSYSHRGETCGLCTPALFPPSTEEGALPGGAPR